MFIYRLFNGPDLLTACARASPLLEVKTCCQDLLNTRNETLLMKRPCETVTAVARSLENYKSANKLATTPSIHRIHTHRFLNQTDCKHAQPLKDSLLGLHIHTCTHTVLSLLIHVTITNNFSFPCFPCSMFNLCFVYWIFMLAAWDHLFSCFWQLLDCPWWFHLLLYLTIACLIILGQ